MDGLKPPAGLDLHHGNLSENWRRFRQRFELYSVASGYATRTAKVQSSLFLHVAGEDAVEVYNTFTFENDDERYNLVKIMEQFETYCNPKKNITYERYKFFTCVQGEMSISQYVTELRRKAKSCEFGELEESLIRDRLVCGIKLDSLRERLLRESEATLGKCVQICIASETTKAQMQQMHEEKNAQLTMTESRHIDAIKQKQSCKNEWETKTKTERPSFKCKRCGIEHLPRSCPAFGKQCRNCDKMNHFAKMCRSKKVHAVAGNVTESCDDLFVGVVQAQSLKHTKASLKEEWTTDLEIGKTCVNFKLDTGAQANVIPYSLLEKMGKRRMLRNSNVKLSTYTGEKISVKGQCDLAVKYKNMPLVVRFVVTKREVKPVLGIQTCEELNLVQRVMMINDMDIFTEYADVFEGMGCLEGEHSIRVDEKVTPKVHPPRKVPVAIRERLKAELERMERMKVIKKVEEPTKWVNPFVIVEKPNGSLRICLDPRDLNAAVMREHYQLPTVDEITCRLPKAKYFSVLDASSGFWQIKLDDASSRLCTFNTPFGRYRFLRLPFGIKSASEVFHKKVQQLFEGIDGVETYIDDILVWAETKEQHDDRLRQVLERARIKNFRLNQDKCKICLDEIKYLGHIITKDGLKPDMAKLEAVRGMPIPECKKDVSRFLGMVTFLAKFVPNLSQHTTILRDLLKDEVEWQWKDEHQQAFERLKLMLTETPVLHYYDVSLPVTVSVDASKSGLGAVLLQEDSPVAYASRALTVTEQRYAQIEKEMLAIVFGVERFHQFVYGREIEVQTDHKPLEIIMKKPLNRAPARIQRLLMRLQKYQLNVKFRPGKEMYVADTLSRACLAETETSEKVDITEAQVHMLLTNVPVSEKKLTEFQRETEKDATLMKLLNIVQNGWPRKMKKVPREIQNYWNYREEISAVDGILFKGEQIIVPASMRADMLHRIHESHLGIESCRRRAREVLFWPGMSKSIEDMVSHCEVCSAHRRFQTREPLQPHSVPDRPWQKIGVDLFTFDKKEYLIIVDYFSKFIEVDLLKNDTRSLTVIKLLKSQFARYGIPDVLISDNGPQFASKEFRVFSKEWEFHHKTTSPHHAQSNGMVERAVQTVKRMLRKTEADERDPYISLLNLRNTPLETIGVSPAQLLMGRRVRTRLPASTVLLNPKTVTASVKESLETHQKKQKERFDCGTKQLQKLTVGENVRVWQDGVWNPAQVTALADQPRSYVVETPDGQLYRRNRKYLMSKTGEYKAKTEKVDQSIVNDCHEPMDVLDDKETAISCTGQFKTRSGRIVAKPQRLIAEM